MPSAAPFSTELLHIPVAADGAPLGAQQKKFNTLIQRIAAQRDNPAAETLLGTMTAKGQGAAKDDAIAAAWFLRAARRGYAPAQLALADAFARGRGVPQDTSRARTLAKAAASQGVPGAAQLASRLGPERYAMLTGGRP